MRLTLRIDNVDALPDGGPLSFSTGERNVMIGREPALDWTLPDPSRRISSRHCDIRFENGGFQLYDISSNGTFVNGGTQRVKSPYRLEDGDRLGIGHYVVAVSLNDGAGEAPGFAGYDDIWASEGPALPPIDRRDLMPPKPQARRDADFPDEFLSFSQLQPPAPLPPAPDPFGVPPPAPSPFESPARPLPGAGPAPFGGAPPYAAAPAAPSPFAPPDLPAFRSEPFDSPPVQPRPVVPLQPQPAVPPPPAAAPPRVSPPPQTPPAARGAPAGPDDILARIARGAGIPLEVLTARDAGEVAEEIGQVLRIAVEETAELLKRRSAVRRMARSARTMVSLSDNNPMKFLPRTEEMLEVMFAGRRGYMDARRSVAEAFADLRRHEFASYAAMKEALLTLLEDLSPDAVEKKVGSGAFSFRKTRCWELYVATWVAKTEPHENGMLDVFLTYFGEAYEKASAGKDQS